MSQLHAELSEIAAKLGFDSIEHAEANGYKVVYNKDGASLEPDANAAYNDLSSKEEKDKEAKQLEMVYNAIGYAKDTIAMIYKPDDKPFASPITDITDEKIRDYYYELNSMCIDLSERNVMIWQKEK